MPHLEATLSPALPEDVLELDGLWSSVQCKANACRSGVLVRGRPERGQLWAGIPQAYRSHTYSDFWHAYQGVFGEGHQPVGKETGETAHVERWDNTLRQRLGRFVRKSLAFSKKAGSHRIALALFIHEYNLEHAS